MRIGIYGNDHNIGLMYAEALQQLGHAAKLVLTRPHAAHRPEGFAERYRTSRPDWVFDAGQLEYAEYLCQTPRLSEALNFLDDCDLLLLSHHGVSLAPLWAKPYLCLLTGVDLLFMGDVRSAQALTAGWNPAFRRSAAGRLSERTWLRFLARQRDAISAAARVIHPPRGVDPRADALLDELGVTDDRREFIVSVPGTPVNEASGDGDRLRVVCLMRPRWPDTIPAGLSAAHDSGCERLLAGIRTLRDTQPDIGVAVQVVGHDEDRTVADTFIVGSGLGECVSWHDGPTVEAAGDAIAGADIVLDPFGLPVSGSGAWAGVMAGKPVIGDFGDVWPRCFSEPIPALPGDSPAAVASSLARACSDSDLRRDLGVRARRFALNHLTLPGQLERVLAGL